MTSQERSTVVRRERPRKPLPGLLASWFPLALALAVAAAPLPAQDAGSLSPHGPSHSGAVAADGVPRLGGVRWTVEVDGPVRSTPTVVGDTVYFGSDDGGLYAVDAATGAVLWRFDAGAPVRSAPAVDARTVYVTAGDRRLVAVGRFDGSRRWEVTGGQVIPFPWGLEGWDYFTSSPTLAGDVVLAGFGDGTIRAVRAASGEEAWRFATDGRVRAAPTVDRWTVFVGSADGRMYALDLGTGEQRWAFDTEGVGLRSAEFGFDRRTIQGAATVADGVVYFGSRDAQLYALDAATGTERWRSNDSTTAWVVATPAVHEGVVYSVRSSSRRLRALDARTGEPLYERTFSGVLFGSPMVVEAALYLTSGAGEVVALEAATGDTLWHTVLDGAAFTSPVVRDGVVYVGTDAGTLDALERADGPTPHRVVFWDDELRQNSVIGRLDADRAPVDHLVERGFREVDGAGLEAFFRDRVRDGAPGVVVMAMDALPTTVAPSPEPRGLLVEYLEAGGKVVWTGRPPFYFLRDPETDRPSVDRARATRFTGVDHSTFNADAHAHRPTPAGHRWGLTGWWMGQQGVDPRDVTTVLATDDVGLAAAWVKSYGGPAGTGFVVVPWSTSEEGLERLRRVAEYGVFRRP